ncbi:branched-chain amino acid ABC transporter permease [Halorientalis regularis]|jgi:branched-chain amino acid transport system permease protein|uniref:Amino acid/amide ABC transporter membrane protein 1, HAAT family n=1 Tax=Halorientalis regularis TaxID=660518 RepID=A0A1G7P776_9EURY|nr:branched-chain amino acid ABC transporter permease [Halorientalis regularis]SDF82093.1 amino acid/amide ABC transporter membrane protein 1, HAAT family [Halorientalis regularis]
MVNTGLVVDQVITGLSIGSYLFLIAVGLSLIFGVLEVLNFAHGVLYMIGAYVGIMAVQSATGNFWLGLVLAALVVGLIGVVMEVGFLRRVYDRDELDQLLLTFAFVLIITDGVRYVFGSGSRIINPPPGLRFSLVLSETAAIPSYRAFVILASVLVLGGILLALRTTNFGRVVRATSSDRDMALLLGIDVPKLYTGVFFIGAALAGFGGALAAPLQSVTPELGNQVIINAFVVVVIGGLGSFTGAFVGAYLIGIMIAVGSIFAAGAGQLFPFVALIAVLLLKPEGIVGGAEA